MKLGQEGFSFIELVAVIVVLGIMAAVIVVRNPLATVKLDAAVSKVKSDIRYTRKLAVSTQARSALSFGADGYSVYHDVVAAALANSPGDPCSTDASGKFVVDFTASRCSHLNGVTLASTVATVAFDSLGRPVDSAGSTLPDVTVTVTSGASRSITIKAQTGRVSD